mmetsp:Transcript_6616/g.23341  ORF Transcript_6616/g.23341 Transcript_6616/m.23341 type:complete len:337 (+) Transcript_6616:38-1048(+)
MGCGSSTHARNSAPAPTPAAAEASEAQQEPPEAPARASVEVASPPEPEPVKMGVPEVVASGLRFGETPRWHDGALWFSDQHDRFVCRVVPGGEVEKVLEVEKMPSGLGWLPDGRMVVVSMQDSRVLRREEDGSLVTHADLSALAGHELNDMVVDSATGRLYVGDVGWDFRAKGAVKKDGPLIAVEPDGAARVATDGLDYPNGTVLLPDGTTLVVAESFGARLTAFDVDQSTGALSNRRLWAQMPPGRFADGICADAEGGVWVASLTNQTLRVKEGGPVTHVVEHEEGVLAVACMLGGDDGRTLFVCTSKSSDPKETEERTAQIVSVRVETPHGGCP